MILDTSAIVAMVLKEPGHKVLREKLVAADAVGIGAPTLAETALVLSARLKTDARGLLARFLSEAEVEVIPFGDAHYSAAAGAWLSYGRGRHPANLSLGDCMAYAAATVAGQPLLCVGDGLPNTDISLACRLLTAAPSPAEPAGEQHKQKMEGSAASEQAERSPNATEEDRVVEHAGLADLDPMRFLAYLRSLGLEIEGGLQAGLEDGLRHRGALLGAGEEAGATLYGLLAFGRTPQEHDGTASFFVRCVHYKGLDRVAGVLRSGKAQGRLDDQVRRALAWVCPPEPQASLGELEAVELPTVPEAALREALVNAVVHRDYTLTGREVLVELFDDRVTVTSPGTLPAPLTPDMVKAGGHSRARNELMANFLAAKGMAERRGRGFAVLREEMEGYNGSEPKVEEDLEAGHVRVTLLLHEADTLMGIQAA